MITITEKDGACIIVIETPNSAEKELIKKAKEVKSSAIKASGVWSKFKCNQNKNVGIASNTVASGWTNEAKEQPVAEQPAPQPDPNKFVDFDGFEEDIDLDDYPSF